MQRLRQERKRRGLSNYAVSKRSGVSQSMLSMLDNGLRNPTLETVLKIADAVAVDLPDILRQAQLNVGAQPKPQRKAQR